MQHIHAVLGALSLAVAGAAPACAQTTLLQPASAKFNERLTDRVPVSGRTLVGLIRTDGAALSSTVGLGDGKLAVIAAPGAGRTICVRATTQDGRYVAENTFTQAAPAQADPEAAATVPLAWPTAYPVELRNLPLREVAVLATAGACGQGGPVIPAATGASASPSEPFLQVLANTRGAATWAVLRDPEAGGPALRRVRCIRSEAGDRVAFDVLCPIGVPPSGATRLELRLEQQGRDGRSLEVVERVGLLLPGRPATHP